MAEARADVQRLRAQLAEEHAASQSSGDNIAGGVQITNPSAEERLGDSGKPPQETVEDAISEARRRGGGRTRSEQEAERRAADGETDPASTGPAYAADGRSTTADDPPPRLGWSDGVAAARARYPKGQGTGDAGRTTGSWA